MGSTFDLMPQPADPDLRIASRLAAIEQRLAAIEARRDIIITPIDVDVSAAIPSVSFSYNWKGGRLWVLWGGSGSQHSGGAAGVRATMTFGSYSVQDLISYSAVDSATVGLGSVASDIPASSLVIGNNTVTIANVGTSSIRATGLIIEWPQA